MHCSTVEAHMHLLSTQTALLPWCYLYRPYLFIWSLSSVMMALCFFYTHADAMLPKCSQCENWTKPLCTCKVTEKQAVSSAACAGCVAGTCLQGCFWMHGVGLLSSISAWSIEITPSNNSINMSWLHLIGLTPLLSCPLSDGTNMRLLYLMFQK